MRPAALVVVAVGIIAALGAGAWFFTAASPTAAVARGAEVYAGYCASCHGANLEGQPDWRTRLPNGRLPAPPHDETGHTWHHADQDLFRIVKEGIAAILPDYESDMPGFGDILSDDDISAVIAFIKSTWPERERATQAARTRARTEAEQVAR